MNESWRLGIDVGGTGVKGNVVDTRTGELTAERVRIETPHPATPEAVAGTVKQILDEFDWRDSFGCTFPAVVQHGVTRTAANVDRAWIDCDAALPPTFEARSSKVTLHPASAARMAAHSPASPPPTTTTSRTAVPAVSV